MKGPRERYYKDPQFKMLVDMMTNQIVQCHYTPSEMREAALLASIKYEEINIHKQYIASPELEEALATVHRINNTRSDDRG